MVEEVFQVCFIYYLLNQFLFLKSLLVLESDDSLHYLADNILELIGGVGHFIHHCLHQNRYLEVLKY